MTHKEWIKNVRPGAIRQAKALGHPVTLRPPMELFLTGGYGVLICSCGASLWTIEDMQDYWQKGHFDDVFNPTDEEVPDAVPEVGEERPAQEGRDVEGQATLREQGHGRGSHPSPAGEGEESGVETEKGVG